MVRRWNTGIDPPAKHIHNTNWQVNAGKLVRTWKEVCERTKSDREMSRGGTSVAETSYVMACDETEI